LAYEMTDCADWLAHRAPITVSRTARGLKLVAAVDDKTYPGTHGAPGKKVSVKR
jgi:hypothetical protein